MRKHYNGFNTFSLKSNRHRIVSERISCKQPVFSDTSESFIKQNDDETNTKVTRKSIRTASDKAKTAIQSHLAICSSSEKENNKVKLSKIHFLSFSSCNAFCFQSSNWSSLNLNNAASQSSEDSLFAFKPKEAKVKIEIIYSTWIAYFLIFISFIN